MKGRSSLINMLKEENEGARRIVLADSNAAGCIQEFVTSGIQQVDLFRDVRILSVDVPEERLSVERQTACQARMIMIAVLARLFERDGAHTPVIESLLREMLAGSFVSSDTSLTRFLAGLGTTEEDASVSMIFKRIMFFLDIDNAISLMKKLEMDLRITQKFWTYA
jgi:hypothetical protein